MRTPLAWMRDVFAAFRGEDPRREQRFVVPYGVTGIYLSADESLSLATVWACVDVIARNIASCKWCLYEPVYGTKRRNLLDDDWRAWMLNTRPNPEMTAIGFREALLFQAIPYGNAYAEIVRDRGGRVNQLWPLMSDRMRPFRDPKTWELLYEYTQPSGEKEFFTQDQIFHLRGPGLWGLMGENVVARAAKTLGVAAAQERFSASFFGQGAQLSGVLEFTGKLDPKRHEQLKNDWAERYKGPENAHKPIILESGMKYNPISTEPQKAQLIEGRKFSVEEICRWFGVPPHKVQHLDHATFSNIEHSSIEFVRDALAPWERRLCQEADAKLFDQTRAPWRYTEIDLRPLTRGDAQSRALAQASWRQNGIMSANEIRAMEGLDDCGDDGDVLLVQKNMTTVELIVDPPPPPVPALPAGDKQSGDGGEGDSSEGDQGAESDDATKDIAKQAVFAALGGALQRYGRRLTNRRRDLRGSSTEQQATLVSFRVQQRDIILGELAPFKDFFAKACGRAPTPADVDKAINMHERSVELEFIFSNTFVQQLPSST